MALYVRLQINFWSNRKTIRLQSLIGESAFWVPPRLWCYAAQNQPDGDFSKYSEKELALLIGYNGDAQALLQALKSTGFLTEESTIHDWPEHNGYHQTFSDRAKIAAQTRWDKEKEKTRKREEKKGNDKKGKEASIATSMHAQNGAQEAPPLNGVEPFILELKADVTYAGIDVEREFGKMANWCKIHGKQPSKRRFVNWLNKAEIPISTNGHQLPLNGISGVDKSILNGELARLNQEIGTLRQNYSGHQTWDWSDKEHMKEMKTRRTEIMDKLGVKF